MPVLALQGRQDNDFFYYPSKPTHKSPTTLRVLSQDSLSNIIRNVTQDNIDKQIIHLRKLGNLLKSSLPLIVRTELLGQVSKDLNPNKYQLFSLFVLHFASDVKRLSFKFPKNDKCIIQLEKPECDALLKELESYKSPFRLEFLELDGFHFEDGKPLMSFIFQHCPKLKLLHLSGTNCSDTLDLLQKHPIALSSLILDRTTVTDTEVVSGILGQNCLQNFSKEANIIHKSLVSLEVRSPFFTVCGAMTLTNFLPNLKNIQYQSLSTFEINTLLESEDFITFAMTTSSFSLMSLDMFRPTEEDVLKIQRICPQLQQLMIECYHPTMQSLDLLSGFQQLSSLSLRLVSEELIFSAIQALKNTIQELCIEFHEFTYRSISSETLRVLQENCPKLQKFAIRNVNIQQLNENSQYCKSKINKKRFPELLTLEICNGKISPGELGSFIQGNNVLNTLILDTKKEALTDYVLNKIRSSNDFREIRSITLGAGMLSPEAVTSLASLPSLSSLNIDLRNFPLITKETFNNLQKHFVQSNYLCTLKNVSPTDL